LENVTHNFSGKNLPLIPSILSMAVVRFSKIVGTYEYLSKCSATFQQECNPYVSRIWKLEFTFCSI